MTARRKTGDMAAKRPTAEDLEKMTDAQRKKALAKMAKADAKAEAEAGADEEQEGDAPEVDPPDPDVDEDAEEPEAPEDDAPAPDEDAIKAKAEAEKPDELKGAITRGRCPNCNSPAYHVTSSPLGPIHWVKCDLCETSWKQPKPRVR